MDSTPPSSKRMKTRGVKMGGRLEVVLFRRMKRLKSYYMRQVGKQLTTQSSSPLAG